MKPYPQSLPRQAAILQAIKVCTCGLYDAREDLAKLQLRYQLWDEITRNARKQPKELNK